MRFSTETGLLVKSLFHGFNTWCLIYIEMELDLPTESKWHSISQK